MAATEEDQLRGRAYAYATGQLRDRHRDEFQELYKAACAEYGVQYKGRLTGEAKAQRDLDNIRTKYPHLFEGS